MANGMVSMQLWSWVLTAVGVTGLYFAGKRKAWAWLIGLGAQVLWLAYAVTTKQYGFIVSAGAYGWVYTRNTLLWMRSAHIEREKES
jgi:hypothetical protein